MNNLKYADDTNLMAESEEELKSLLMRVKEASEKAGLKLKHKTKLRSWLQSPSTVIWEPKKIKSATVSTFSPSISHEVMGLDVTILAF